MGKVVRIPAGNTTNVHYNFVVAKPLVIIIIITYFGTTYLHGNSTIYYIIIIKYVTFLIYRKDSLHM